MTIEYPAVYNSGTSAWQSIAGQSLPEGGDDGQVLTKSSSASYDVGWETLDLSTKADKNLTVNQQGSSYILQLSDNGKLVEIDVTSSDIVTVPSNDSVPFPIGSQITILRTNTGSVSIGAGNGVTINATPGLNLRAQWSSATLIKRDTDTWVAIGDLTT